MVIPLKIVFTCTITTSYKKACIKYKNNFMIQNTISDNFSKKKLSIYMQHHSLLFLPRQDCIAKRWDWHFRLNLKNEAWNEISFHTAYRPLNPSLATMRRTAAGGEENCPVCILCLTTWKISNEQEQMCVCVWACARARARERERGEWGRNKWS